MLTLILLLAQIHTSHFQRLPMPMAMEWASKHIQPVTYEGNFVMPKSGKWTLDYQKLYPGDYTKIPTRCEFRDLTNAATPIYDIEESYDHITVQSKRGHKLKWNCVMAVPEAPKSEAH